MRRAPAVVVASAAGFVGVVAMHAGAARASLLSGSRSRELRPATTSRRRQSPSTTPTAASQRERPRTAVGNSEQYGYGVLAVKVTIRQDRITDVSVARSRPPSSTRSQLAQQVIPLLRNEVLSAQSAHINAISGATYTSEAYAYSVQSALDRFGAK